MIDKQKIEKSIKAIIEAIGEDPTREGLIDTPSRVANMYEELFCGIDADPSKLLRIFNESHVNSEFVSVKDIPVFSVCEHHLLPFFGKASIVYTPSSNKIIGISKLARIVDLYARRPQVQERLTSEIADFLYNNLDAQSVAVMIEAEHLCMTMRGARSIGSKTKTLELRGEIKEDPDKRAQVISML